MNVVDLQSVRSGFANAGQSLEKWWVQQRFSDVRLEFYQDYVDSKMMMREFAQARAAQLKKRGDGSYKAVNEIAKLLREGRSVSDALKPVAPPTDVALIQAFEQSNRLEQGFKDIVRKVTEEQALKKEVLGSLVKPVAYMFAALVMVTGGIPLMVDSLGPLLDKARQTVDQRALIAFAGFMQRFSGIIVPLLVALVVAMVASLPFWSGKARRRFDEVSPVHRMYRSYHGASFLKILAIQLSVTPQLDRSLAAIANNSSPWLRAYIVDIMRALPHNRIHPMDAFDVGLLDAKVIDSLALVSRRGTAEEAIALRAQQSTETAVKSIRKSAGVLQNVAIAAAGSVLIWVTVSLVLNVIKTNMEMAQQSQSGARR